MCIRDRSQSALQSYPTHAVRRLPLAARASASVHSTDNVERRETEPSCHAIKAAPLPLIPALSRLAGKQCVML
eukprot:14097995-Alexandrium_andersonii.AAC.1